MAVEKVGAGRDADMVLRACSRYCLTTDTTDFLAREIEWRLDRNNRQEHAD